MNFSLTYPSQIDVIILSMEKILRTVETYRIGDMMTVEGAHGTPHGTVDREMV